MKIFITGISSGIGRALCKELVASEHLIWGVARNKGLLMDLKNEIKSNNFFYSVCDISSEEEIKKTTVAMEEMNFLPDVVVLNAGIERKDLKYGYQGHLVHEVFLVNYFGALKWVELFIKKFAERGSGHFIAISSIFAKRPDIDSFSYCSSKAALSMAFRSLYLKYYLKNIEFTNIYFGPVDTNISSSYRSSPGSQKKSFIIISPETAAKCIVKAMKGKRPNYYFPYFITLPVRLTLFLSDIFFYKLTRLFRR